MPTVFDSATSSPVKPKTSPAPVRSDKINLFTCYAENPSTVRFETQEADEVVLLFLRQHFIVNVPWMLAAVAMAMAPLFIFPILISLFGISTLIPASYVLVGTLFWYLATLGFVIVKFIGWYFNIYIVTNERIVDIDFINLLVKRFSQAELSRIQNITYSASGIMATFFNYGNVTVETAGETPNIECTSVPRPDKVVEQIRSVSANSGRPE